LVEVEISKVVIVNIEGPPVQSCAPLCVGDVNRFRPKGETGLEGDNHSG